MTRENELTREQIEQWRIAWANDGLKPEVFAQLNAMCDLALAALSERVWVPVSERLPERNIHVLLRFQNGQCDVGKWGGRRWIDPFGDDGEDFITPAHWMPLPPLAAGAIEVRRRVLVSIIRKLRK